MSAGRAGAIAALAALAALLPADALPRERPAALLACLLALALHAALYLGPERRPGLLRAAAQAGLVVDAGLVAALALASGGADSLALWLLLPAVVAVTVGYSARLGVQAALLAVLVTLGVRILDDRVALLSHDDRVRLALLAVLVPAAAAAALVNERDLRRRGDREAHLQEAASRISVSDEPQEMLERVRVAAARLMPGWDVRVEREGGDGERLWRDAAGVHVAVPVRVRGEEGVGRIAARRAIPRRGGSVRLRHQELAALRALAGLLGDALGRARLVHRLERLSATDELTGLGNRRTFDEALRAELGRARRTGLPLGLVLLDIDRFKDLNDAHGHQAGDAVLASLGRLLRAQMRGEDRACRFGGEEFALLLPATGEAQATAVAERVRRAVAAMPAPAGRVTASLGVAVSAGRDDGERLVAAADERLYRAKHEGRDRVVAGAMMPVG